MITEFKNYPVTRKNVTVYPEYYISQQQLPQLTKNLVNGLFIVGVGIVSEHTTVLAIDSQCINQILPLEIVIDQSFSSLKKQILDQERERIELEDEEQYLSYQEYLLNFYIELGGINL